jgi:Kdo2-lipid IVA lauroyltransferase/acyltransferase
MQDKLEYFLFVSLSRFFCFIGIRKSRAFAFPFALLFFYFIPIRKKTVITNIKIAFPQLNKNEIKKLAFRIYKSFLITLIEILCLPTTTKEEISNSITFENIELIKQKFNEGNGVILLSAHFGNWEYVALSSSAQLNLPFSVVVKDQRNPFVTDWMNSMRTKWLNEIVPLGVSIRKVYQTLKSKKIVAMVADQRAPKESARIKFFGREVPVHTGPAVLAIKTGAPLLYGIPVRQPDFSYKTEMVEISKENLPEDENEKIIELTRRHMNYLEEYIRLYPEQWLWMHKRWKY